jgi:hypothetical protein
MRALHGQGCPFCAGKRASVTNSLAAFFPKVAAEWHPTKNGGLTPADVVGGAKAFATWRCAVHHVWRARVVDRPRGGRGCRSHWLRMHRLVDCSAEFRALYSIGSDLLDGGGKG